MKLSISATGLQQQRGRLAGLAERLRNLGPAYLRSGVVVLTAAQQHIRDDGPGWAPTVETARGSALYRTGALFRSLQVGGEGNVDEQTASGTRVGTNLKTPGGQYSIGRLMQYGVDHPILPKRVKLLVFEINGTKIFSRGTKGIPARPFLFIDSQTAEKVRGVFQTYIFRGDTTA